MNELENIDDILGLKREAIIDYLNTFNLDSERLDQILTNTEKLAYENRENFKDLKKELDKRYREDLKEKLKNIET